MGKIFTIFKKEMVDMLRDRRTVLTMIVMPMLLMPVILTVVAKISSDRIEKANSKVIHLAIESNDNGNSLVRRLERRQDIKIIDGINKDDFNKLIKDDSLDIGLEISNTFDATIAEGKTGEVDIYFDSTNEGIFIGRIREVIKSHNDSMLFGRLAPNFQERDGIKPEEKIHPIASNRKDVYTKDESMGKIAGGFLPYIFVIFCLVGAMYPAIDLFTGEKERGTMETILTVPASRLQILIGKMLVVVLSGVISGMLTIFGLFLALKLNEGGNAMMQSLTSIANHLLTFKPIALIILMLIPLTTFFSGILIPASIYSKSFKEAQSMIQPMTIFIIIPLIIAMMPGFQLNVMTALIPVVNVALATKDIVAGTIDYGLFALVFLSLFIFAAISIALCIKWFGSEKNILRT